jgi:mRNA interferase MazF
VIVQAEAFDTTDSVTVAICTTVLVDAPFRVMILATPASGLRHPSAIMADKLLTVQRTTLGERVGQVSPGELDALNRALVVFLGLAETVAP